MTTTSEPMPEPQLDPSVLEEPNATSTPSEPPPSYVKLAMRNMVKKRGQSLIHFALTATGLMALLIGLSYLTR